MNLRDFFKGVAAKRLSAVEANPKVSNQREFNGINKFKQILGAAKHTFDAVFLYVDDEDTPFTAGGKVTWYDAREHDPDRSEWRLYFQPTLVSGKYREGDLLIVGIRPDRSLLIACTPLDSNIATQLLWLFGLAKPNGHSEVRDEADIDRDVDFAVRLILDSIGIEPPASEFDIDLLHSRFNGQFPPTKDFSLFAREHSRECDPINAPDESLLVWLETEERMFRTLEHHIIEESLRNGFVTPGGSVDVDEFLRFSLSVQNRRKSRAGHALEHHIAHILHENKVRFARGVYTEQKSKPDFLFPGREEYLDAGFPDHRLTMLAAKASCKERWRQAVGEAARIDTKHLLTLEPSISEPQTEEMIERRIQLVIPTPIHATYTESQRRWLWSIASFIKHVKSLQDL